MQTDLKELHAEFMNYARFSRRVSPDTLRGYAAAFQLLLKRYPDLSVAGLTSEAFAEFFRWLSMRPRRVGKDEIRRGVKKSTIATYWRKLSKFCGWLERKGVIAANPLRAGGEMEFPRVRYDDRKFLSRQDVSSIYRAIRENIAWQNDFLRTRNVALISVALNCGLRRGELLALKASDIDLKSNEVIVQAETSKSQQGRVVPLNSQARRDIAEYLDQRAKYQCLVPYLWIEGNRNAERLTAQGLRYLVDRVRKASGVRFHLHQLRHTFAVNFLHNTGHNSMKLQGLLGQRSIVSTAIYTRCLPLDMVRADVERIAHNENLV